MLRDNPRANDAEAGFRMNKRKVFRRFFRSSSPQAPVSFGHAERDTFQIAFRRVLFRPAGVPYAHCGVPAGGPKAQVRHTPSRLAVNYSPFFFFFRLSRRTSFSLRRFFSFPPSLSRPRPTVSPFVSFARQQLLLRNSRPVRPLFVSFFPVLCSVRVFLFRLLFRRTAQTSQRE